MNMDPRYEDEIKQIVRSREGNFTARDVVDDLTARHPNDEESPLPSGKAVAAYLLALEGVEKMGRGGQPPTNQYRYTLPPDSDQMSPETQHALRQVKEGRAFGKDDAPPPDPLPTTEAGLAAIRLPVQEPTAEEQAAIRAKIEAAVNAQEGGCAGQCKWIYQEAAMVCPICQSYKEFEEPYPDALKELWKEYTPGAFNGVTNLELGSMFIAFIRSSQLRDKSTKKGKEAAIRDTVLAEACTEILARHARLQRRNIRRMI